MAYTNPFRIANGLQLDFTVEAADTANDNFLGVSSSGQATKFTSIPRSRVSGGGNLTEATSSVLTITGGTAAVLTSGLTIQVKLAGAAQSGYLSTTDWNTFNNKQGTTLNSGQMWVGNSSNVATARTITGDIAVSDAGVVAISNGVIINSDISGSAAISFSKMAAFAGTNLMLAADGSGLVATVAGFTTTIAGYLTNISSDVQAQFTTLASRIVNIAVSATGLAPSASENGYALIWDDGNSEWTLGPVGSGGSVTGPGVSVANAITTWNGTGGTSLLSNATGVTLDGTGNMGNLLSVTSKTVNLLDSDDSHSLILSATSDLTGDHILALVTGDADRTITLSGDPTLDDWFDQAVKTTSNAVFASVTLSNAGALHILDSDESHDLIITTSSNLSADRTLTLVTGDANRTLTINASGTVYVTGGTDVALADGGTGQSLADPGAHRLWGWDNTDNAITFITIGTGLAYDQPSHTLSSTGGASIALSSITAAVATHTIDNTVNPLVWSWTGAAAGSLFSMSSASTGIAGSGTQNILSIASSGANTNSTVTSRGLNITVTHTGTASVNIGAELSASGASTNYALYVAAGDILHAPLAGGGVRIVSVSNTGVLGAVTTAALTKADDTNVTLTLGGTPATALLQATSLTLGWTGTLAYARFVSGAGLSVVGRAANSSGVQADIAAGSDYNILRRSGTSIAFGAIDLSQAGAVGASVLPVANGGTGSASGTGLISGLTADRIPYATSATALANGPYWNNSTGFFGIGAAPTYMLDVQTSSVDPVFRMLTATGQPTFYGVRTGGTASDWQMYLPGGSTQFRFYSGGADRFTFTTDGQFTGTGSSSGGLDHKIVNTGTGHAGHVVQRTGTTPGLWLSYIPSGVTDFRLYDGTADRFWFTTDSKLGIGASPTYDLDIQKSSASNVTANILNTSTGQSGIRIARSGGTTSTWELYSPSASTDIRLYSGADRFTFTTAGLFTAASLQATGLTSGRVSYSTTAGLQTDSSLLTFDGTYLYAGGLKSGTTANGIEILSSGYVQPYGAAVNLNILGFTGIVSSTSGSDLLLQGGDAYVASGTGSGGDVHIRAGNSGPSGGTPGNVNITTGAGIGGGHDDGDINMTAADGDLNITVAGIVIQVEDDFTVDNAITATDFIATSDISVKSNIEPFTSGLDKVLSISPWVKRYNNLNSGLDGEIGFVAQELYKVAPEYVSTGGELWGVNYAKMVAPLYKAIEELNAEIERLKEAA